MAKPAAKKSAEAPVTTIRFDAALKDALAQAAWEDRRSSSAKLKLILAGWLLERGYLQETPTGWAVVERKAVIKPSDE